MMEGGMEGAEVPAMRLLLLPAWRTEPGWPRSQEPAMRKMVPIQTA